MPAESGFNSHDQRNFKSGDVWNQSFGRGSRFNGHPCFLPELVKLVNCGDCVFMRLCLNMKDYDISAGLSKSCGVPSGRCDHQVHIKCHIGGFSHRFKYRQPNRDIGDKYAVHYVDVQIVSGFYAFYFISEFRKVCGKYRRGYFDHFLLQGYCTGGNVNMQ